MLEYAALSIYYIKSLGISAMLERDSDEKHQNPFYILPIDRVLLVQYSFKYRPFHLVRIFYIEGFQYSRELIFMVNGIR